MIENACTITTIQLIFRKKPLQTTPEIIKWVVDAERTSNNQAGQRKTFNTRISRKNAFKRMHLFTLISMNLKNLHQIIMYKFLLDEHLGIESPCVLLEKHNFVNYKIEQMQI